MHPQSNFIIKGMEAINNVDEYCFMVQIQWLSCLYTNHCRSPQWTNSEYHPRTACNKLTSLYDSYACLYQHIGDT